MEKIRWTGDNILDIRRFALRKVRYDKKLHVRTAEGMQVVELGDYVVKDGEALSIQKSQTVFLPKYACDQHHKGPKTEQQNAEWTQGIYQRMGITVLQETSHYLEVQLPKGWCFQSAGHPYWKEVMDEKNRRRIVVCEERDIHAVLLTRYNYKTLLTSPRQSVITDAGVIVKTMVENVPLRVGEHEKAQITCREYLDEKYPDWKDTWAYWEEC